jgi:hypothetical protein
MVATVLPDDRRNIEQVDGDKLLAACTPQNIHHFEERAVPIVYKTGSNLTGAA